jgi:hypothetical protein
MREYGLESPRGIGDSNGAAPDGKSCSRLAKKCAVGDELGSSWGYAKWMVERPGPSLAAILTRSAREVAFIFCITCPR